MEMKQTIVNRKEQTSANMPIFPTESNELIQTCMDSAIRSLVRLEQNSKR